MINNLESENDTGVRQLFMAIVSIVLIVGVWFLLDSIHIA
jgi:hypothetical protein